MKPSVVETLRFTGSGPLTQPSDRSLTLEDPDRARPEGRSFLFLGTPSPVSVNDEGN